MNSTVETNYHLTHDEMAAVCAAASGCRASETLDEAEANLRSLFRGWFVYRGGSHVALHRTADDDRRVLVVTEQPVAKAGRSPHARYAGYINTVQDRFLDRE